VTTTFCPTQVYTVREGKLYPLSPQRLSLPLPCLDDVDGPVPIDVVPRAEYERLEQEVALLEARIRHLEKQLARSSGA
jgi:hypothetical protein